MPHRRPTRLKSPRDMQRKKVYRSEETVDHGTKMESLAEVQAFVAKVVGSRWWRSRHPHVAEVEVLDGRGRRRAYGSPVHRHIKMPIWSRTPLVVLHELSHVVTPMRVAAHGREYCKNYLHLVRRFMGDETYKSLRESFRKNHVHWIVRERKPAPNRGKQ